MQATAKNLLWQLEETEAQLEELNYQVEEMVLASKGEIQ